MTMNILQRDLFQLGVAMLLENLFMTSAPGFKIGSWEKYKVCTMMMTSRPQLKINSPFCFKRQDFISSEEGLKIGDHVVM